MVPAPRKLSDNQVESFDVEFVKGDRWRVIEERIGRDFPDGRFTFLDVGGGNGVFADRILAAYPLSRGTVLDNSRVLLARNKPHGQKDVVYGSATDLRTLPGLYDLVCMNFLLHHLVGDSYEASGRHVAAALAGAGRLLSPRGRISVLEDMYIGRPFDGLPGRLIFTVTAFPTFGRLTRRLGANTGGVGVCFRSRREWMRIFRESGLDILDATELGRDLPVAPIVKTALLIDRRRTGHFWLRSPLA